MIFGGYTANKGVAPWPINNPNRRIPSTAMISGSVAATHAGLDSGVRQSKKRNPNRNEPRRDTERFLPHFFQGKAL